MSSDDLDSLFAPEDEEQEKAGGIAEAPEGPPWPILVVDDDEEVHVMTRLVLSKLRYNDRPLELLMARSAAEAERILRRRDDIAVALVDIVMETDDAGLRLARRIREDFNNEDVRIVLRTGQPGQAPVRDVIVSYDINDYKSKTELTSEKLFITIVTALRSFDNIRSARAAESASKLKSSFLAAMSHEIRTPMNGVLGMLELMSHSRLDEDQREMLDTARDSAGALLRIIDDILDFSKIEAGRMDIDRQPVQLCGLIETVAETVAANARAKGLALHVHVDPAIPECLLGDPIRLRQVLFNLAGNALKFTEKGSVTIRANAVPSAVVGWIRVHVDVIDTGIGIADDMQSRLFQPFTQAEKTTSRRFGGTGLGLSISRRLVELMNGAIGLDSAVGQGSTFWFDLDLEVGPPDPESKPTRLDGVAVRIDVPDSVVAGTIRTYLAHAGAAVIGADAPADVTVAGPGAERPGDGSALVLVGVPEPRGAVPSPVPLVTLPLRRQALLRAIAQAAGARPTGRSAGTRGRALRNPAGRAGLRVLVAEDQPVNQMVIRRQLGILGVQCDLCCDGKIALEAWRHQRYDLVLTDCNMPEMDGFELTEAIRAAEAGRGRRTPIIALTANAMAGEDQRCLKAGMDGFLSKPIDITQLERCLDEWTVASEQPGPEPAAADGAGEEGLFDTTQVLDLFGRIDGDARAFLDGFLESAHRLCDELLADLAAEDAEAARRSAHALAGVAKTAGAMPLGLLCTAVEQQLLKAAVPRAADLAAGIPELLARTERAVRAI